MARPARERYLSIKRFVNLVIKNSFSIFYFLIVGTLLAIVYTQLIFKPSFLATGTISNTTYQEPSVMINIANTAKEELTIEKTLDKMNISTELREEKKKEILSKLNSSYNGSSYKVIITYSSMNEEEATIVVNFVIDSTLERFIEANPSMEGKVARQLSPISVVYTGLSNGSIFILFVVGGAVFGLIIGLGADLVNRSLLFPDDIYAYELQCNIVDLELTKATKDSHLDSLDFKNSLVVLADKIEGSNLHKKVKVVGVVNLGYKKYEGISTLLAENSATVNKMSLIIDLNLENPTIHEIYNVNHEQNSVNIIHGEEPKPIKVKDNLYILPADKYSFPASFLKDESLKEYIDKYAKEYDIVFINLPKTDYYGAIALHFNLIDTLLINTSFGGTKLKVLDRYIESIDDEERERVFINAINSKVKREFPQFLNSKKRPNSP